LIEPKEIPQEFVSIRQVWLKQIDRCAEALSHRFMKDVQDQMSERSGLETFAESVIALNILLVDYGEATIKTDIERWKDKNKYSTKKGEDGKPIFNSRYSYFQGLFNEIVNTLHRYNMLFESQPKGYSNVEMKSI
jgi:hypothetical protein